MTYFRTTRVCVHVHHPQTFGLNSTEDDVEAVEELRRRLRQRYIDIVVVAAVDSADAMDQVNAVMTSLLRRSREVNLAAQVSIYVCQYEYFVIYLLYIPPPQIAPCSPIHNILVKQKM